MDNFYSPSLWFRTRSEKTQNLLLLHCSCYLQALSTCQFRRNQNVVQLAGFKSLCIRLCIPCNQLIPLAASSAMVNLMKGCIWCAFVVRKNFSMSVIIFSVTILMLPGWVQAPMNKTTLGWKIWLHSVRECRMHQLTSWWPLLVSSRWVLWRLVVGYEEPSLPHCNYDTCLKSLEGYEAVEVVPLNTLPKTPSPMKSNSSS